MIPLYDADGNQLGWGNEFAVFARAQALMDALGALLPLARHGLEHSVRDSDGSWMAKAAAIERAEVLLGQRHADLGGAAGAALDEIAAVCGALEYPLSRDLHLADAMWRIIDIVRASGREVHGLP